MSCTDKISVQYSGPTVGLRMTTKTGRATPNTWFQSYTCTQSQMPVVGKHDCLRIAVADFVKHQPAVFTLGRFGHLVDDPAVDPVLHTNHVCATRPDTVHSRGSPLSHNLRLWSSGSLRAVVLRSNPNSMASSKEVTGVGESRRPSMIWTGVVLPRFTNSKALSEIECPMCGMIPHRDYQKQLCS